ncbi:hypothetical protein NM688_g6402 [Phlebia brevispora]|uniref:Uncharacterized protein n=1 Tax=Phlebia brevispora TaxID=194682 RepID=A0ACC1SGH8_9APHY|nr:hypothetical protein NM688_g6402 [Phlebia brevispora]
MYHFSSLVSLMYSMCLMAVQAYSLNEKFTKFPLASLRVYQTSGHENINQSNLLTSTNFNNMLTVSAALISLAMLIPASSAASAPCQCPADTYDDNGTLIHAVTEYWCSYPNGACAWEVVTGNLVQPAQSFCVDDQPCTSAPCTCHDDANGDYGYLIGYPVRYECAYPHGACIWEACSSSHTNIAYAADFSSSARCSAERGSDQLPRANLHLLLPHGPM